jgi:hypothetical protein
MGFKDITGHVPWVHSEIRVTDNIHFKENIWQLGKVVVIGNYLFFKLH